MATIKEAGTIITGKYTGRNFVLTDFAPFKYARVISNTNETNPDVGETPRAFMLNVHLLNGSIVAGCTDKICFSDVCITDPGVAEFLSLPACKYTGNRLVWTFTYNKEKSVSSFLAMTNLRQVTECVPEVFKTDKFLDAITSAINNECKAVQAKIDSFKNASDLTLVSVLGMTTELLEAGDLLLRTCKEYLQDVYDAYEAAHSVDKEDNDALLIHKMSISRVKYLLESKIIVTDDMCETLKNILESYAALNTSAISYLRRIG